MPDVDKCPHCDQGITEQDLANYPRKLREKELRKEFANSDIMRRHKRIEDVVTIIGLLGVLLPIFVIVSDISGCSISNFYFGILIAMCVIVGIFMVAWLARHEVKIDKARIDYVNSRLVK